MTSRQGLGVGGGTVRKKLQWNLLITEMTLLENSIPYPGIPFSKNFSYLLCKLIY